MKRPGKQRQNQGPGGHRVEGPIGLIGADVTETEVQVSASGFRLHL